VKTGVVEESKRKALIDVCRTRWAQRHIAFRHFYQAYIFIVEALEVIGFRLHCDKYELYADWDAQNRSEAQQIHKSITGFDFIIVFLTLYQYLSHMAGITVLLQGRAVDVIKAYSVWPSILPAPVSCQKKFNFE